MHTWVTSVYCKISAYKYDKKIDRKIRVKNQIIFKSVWQIFVGKNSLKLVNYKTSS